MNSKRRHIWFGILGIYIFLLTCFMLFAGVYQFINTIQHYIEMQIIGPDIPTQRNIQVSNFLSCHSNARVR